MADHTAVAPPKPDPRRRSRVRLPLRLLVIGYLFFLVIWPVSLVAKETFSEGLAPVIAALQQPDVIFAFQLTLSVAFWAVLINTVFGVGISLLLVRYTFPGRRALSALVDLPLSVSPIVVGLALLLVYSGHGWLGQHPGSAGAADHLRPGRHDHGHRLRQPAAGHPGDRPRAARDRHRPGAGGPQPRRLTGADLRPDHPARHPLGVALRRGAQPGPVARRVRRGQGRLRRGRDADPDRHLAGRGALPAVRHREHHHRVHRGLHPRLDRGARPDRGHQPSRPKRRSS